MAQVAQVVQVVLALPVLERDDSPPMHEILRHLNAVLGKPRRHGLE